MSTGLLAIALVHSSSRAMGARPDMLMPSPLHLQEHLVGAMRGIAQVNLKRRNNEFARLTLNCCGHINRAIHPGLNRPKQTQPFLSLTAAEGFRVELEGNHQTDNLLSRNLEAAPNSVTWRYLHVLRNQAGKWLPQFDIHIHVQRLQRHRCNQILPSGHKPCTLRSPQGFAATEHNEISSVIDEAGQVGHRRELTCSIHNDGNSVPFCHGCNLR